jgi:G protein beta subunit-like protein
MQAEDASLLAAGNHQGQVYVWQPSEDKASWTPLVNIRAHDSYLLRCVISPDTRQLATASADKTIKLWDTKTWTLSHTLTAHQRWVWDVAYSGDSNYLVSASSDQTAKLWHTGTGEVVRNYTGHSLSVTCVAINDRPV